MTYRKYGNAKVTIDGRTFDSKAEAERYSQLRLLERAGVIRGLECQKVFELIPAYKKNGKTVRAVKYLADFVYWEKNKIIVEDVKGCRTDVYKLKKKLFEWRYPELEIKEVKVK